MNDKQKFSKECTTVPTELGGSHAKMVSERLYFTTQLWTSDFERSCAPILRLEISSCPYNWVGGLLLESIKFSEWRVSDY